jgi:hypothetical protein
MGAESATASVGSLSSTNIIRDTKKGTTPSDWNTHLAKLVTDGKWNYAVFTRFLGTGPHNVAWVYSRRKGSKAWKYTGRKLQHLHQPPGMVLDKAGRLHLSFDCQGLPGAWTRCTPGGASAEPGGMRFYDLIFWKHRANGSLDLGTSPNRYRDYHEFTEKSYGYLGLGTNPATGETYAAVGEGVDQRVFQAGVFNPPRATVPDEYVLYPQLVTSPTGARYYIGTLFPENAFPPEVEPGHEEEPEEDIGGGVVVYRVTDGFQLGFKDVSDMSCQMCQYSSDAAFGPDGRLYFLYYKRSCLQGVCVSQSPNCEATSSYLLTETAPGSGLFTDPVSVGCHNDYAQLQVDSAGTINIVNTSGRDFVIDQSRDGGATWRQYCRKVPGDAVPPNTDGMSWPTLTKPWTSPAGYRPNVLHGYVANLTYGKTSNRSSSANEFSLRIGPGQGRTGC